ncbi:hypothetical protein FACS1894109_16470 [Spirochaetia bacterium]|nr:hypothetical protein FACS1894109_16470 [Spirochaetia bacterium]
MKKTLVYMLIILVGGLSLTGCASTQAIKDLNESEANIARGDPDNNVKVKEYLQNVLNSPDGREIKAYERRAYSPENKKNLFLVHCFYVFLKDGEVEHTLVFTATPKGSELKGCWMLDAASDVGSYNLFLDPSSGNPWEVAECVGSKGELSLNLLQTTQNIITRLDKGYKFFGAASARDLAWYHQVWMFLIPPPILAYSPLLILSINTDNCTSAVLETMAWE